MDNSLHNHRHELGLDDFGEDEEDGFDDENEDEDDEDDADALSSSPSIPDEVSPSIVTELRSLLGH